MEKSKKPQIRFKGFTNDWEQCKLKNVLNQRRILQQQSEKYKRLAFASGQGVIPLSERKTNNRDQLILDETTKKYLVTEINDIVYNPANLKYGAIDRNKYGKGLISPIYVTFTTEEIPAFIEQIVTTEKFKIKALKFEEGTVVKRQMVSPQNLLEFEEMISLNLEEQEKIGKYFETLDSLITLHQRKCEKLKIMKKSCLEKMFPKNNQKIPDVRFKGFTNDWEQRKLKDIGSTYTGLSGKTKDDFGHGESKFITYLNIFSNPISFLNLLELVEVKEQQNKVLYGDILFTTSSETPEEVGMSSVWLGNQDNIYLNSFCFGYRLKEKEQNDLYYFAYMLRSTNIRREIVFLAQGISRYNLSKNKLMEIEVPIPLKEEQKKIGKYFETLDNLITLHQRKVEKLKKIKKSCLEKMFV